MRVYIAGASAEIDLVERTIAAVRAAGHTVTLDWPAEIRRHGGVANGPGLTLSQQRSAVGACEAGIVGAEAFWLLVPKAPSAGCWAELGAAIRERVDMIIASGDTQRSIFCARADLRFSTHDLALEWLVKR